MVDTTTATTINGILKGNGATVSAATSADYLAPGIFTSYTSTRRATVTGVNALLAGTLTPAAVVTPTVSGSTSSGASITINSTDHLTKGKINLGSGSAFDDATESLGLGTTSPSSILHAIGSLATTAVNYVIRVANWLLTKGNSAFIAFTSKDQAGTEYVGGAIGVLFTNHSTNKQRGTIVFETVSSAATVGFKRKLTIDSNGITTVNGSLVIGGDSSGITFANRSTILSGYVRRNTTDTMIGVNSPANMMLTLAGQGVANMASGFELPSQWAYAATISSGALSSDLGGVGALLIGPTYTTSSAAGTADLRISRVESAISSGPNYLIDAGVNSSGHKSVFSVTNHGRALFAKYTSAALTGSVVAVDDLGVRLKGSATTWDDLRVEPTSRSVASAPVFSASGWDSLLYNYRFANGPTAEYLYFNVQMPHSWLEGSGIYPHVHFAPTTTGTGQVDFTIRCSWATPAGTFGTGSDYTVSYNIASNSQYKHVMASNASPVSMTGMGVSATAACRITRSTSDGYAGNADVLYIDIHYEVDSMGSDTATGKTATP